MMASTSQAYRQIMTSVKNVQGRLNYSLSAQKKQMKWLWLKVKLKLDSPYELTAEEIEKDIRMNENEIGWNYDYKIEAVDVT